mgnify:CR=1 FL=1
MDVMKRGWNVTGSTALKGDEKKIADGLEAV